MKILVGLILIISLVIGAVYYFNNGSLFNKNVSRKIKIYISSQEFLNGQTIPATFTCNGDNINPPLSFDRVPGDAKSLVLIVDDPDAGTVPFNHWLVFNIDPSITNIEAGKIPNALEGTNDFGELKYMGPCPTGTHKYYFRIYALDTVLSLNEGAKRSDIDAAMTDHILGVGEFFGVYSK